jgi:8-oxo-dGTP pyrophosphatase MutT (NUDIX family)
MSLTDHIRRCNTFRPAEFVPLMLGGERIGRVRRDNAAALRRFERVFAVEPERIAVAGAQDFDGLSQTFDEVTEALVQEGLVDKWRHELFAVAPRWHAPPVAKIDRGAVAFFGIRSYGVHLNGWRRTADGIALWIGKRAPDKKVAPGKLDNLVAGGIGFGHGVFETLEKEAGEEAGIAPSLIRRAVPVGALSYRMEVPKGLRDDVLFVYDLEVSEELVPRNTDGEIAEFTLMPAREVVERIRVGEDFKFNVNLVIIDFAIRHGLIGPEEAEYLGLVTTLRQPLD